MLLADPRIDTARTFIVEVNPENLAKVTALFRELEAEGRDALQREFGEGAITIAREAEMRYKGQHHSIKIRLADTDDFETLRSRFNQEYVRRYGHANATADIEIVVLHSLATLHTIKPELSQLARGKSSGASALLETRPVFFLEEDRFLPTQVYDRYALGADFSGHGPALVVEYGSSTLIGPGDTFRIGALGEIHIDCHH
jgi:N-methylhydantoinase A